MRNKDTSYLGFVRMLLNKKLKNILSTVSIRSTIYKFLDPQYSSQIKNTPLKLVIPSDSL